MVQNCDWHAHPFFAMIRSKQWKNGSSRILSTMYYVCIILLSTLTLSMPDRCNIKGAIAMLPRARRSRKFAAQCELSLRAISQRCRILPAPHGFLLLIGCVMWSSIPHGWTAQTEFSLGHVYLSDHASNRYRTLSPSTFSFLPSAGARQGWEKS